MLYLPTDGKLPTEGDTLPTEGDMSPANDKLSTEGKKNNFHETNKRSLPTPYTTQNNKVIKKIKKETFSFFLLLRIKIFHNMCKEFNFSS